MVDRAFSKDAQFGIVRLSSAHEVMVRGEPISVSEVDNPSVISVT